MAENIENINAGGEEKKPLNFVQQIVADDLAAGKNGGRLNTRFPPEPNGYLHIGHAKAICMDFGVAEKFGGTCNLRFDDTNPQKEDTEYVEEKGTPTTPGTNSPYRDRTVEENLDLFQRMNAGEFEEGSHVLRAKIDMASSNMHFRDPIIYRIIKTPHWRTGNKWNVYPMYDFAHGQSDYFEGVTHSICTLEFVPHRDLYDYFVHELAAESASEYCPRQIEFNRLNLTYLVKEGLVAGWDDPRMPTLCGLRRRGYTAQSIKNFIEDIGYTKYEALNDIGLLEHNIREELNHHANRVSAVLNPVKVVITNYPEDKVEMMEMDNNPEQENAGKHQMPFSRELYIERDDFMEEPPKKFFRLTPGKEVRLKGAYIIMCTGCTKDADGNVTEIQCTYDPDTLSGSAGSQRKVKGTLHWVSARHCVDAEVRLYDRLFAVENPSADTEHDFRELLNPDSLRVLPEAKIEPFLAETAKVGDTFQFQRIGYFCVDQDSTEGHLVFNRTIGLKDSWAKQQGK